jgi:oxaloacetate decarboxylase alpha subunit
MYGRPAVPIKEEIIRKIIGNEEVITCRPADLLEPVLEAKEKEIGMYIESPEDVLTYVLFPQVALDFFKLRMAEKYSIDNTLVDSEQNVYPI